MKKIFLSLMIICAASMIMGAAEVNAPTVVKTSKAMVVYASKATPGSVKLKSNPLTFNKAYKKYIRPAGIFNSQFMADGHWWKNSTSIGHPRCPMTFKNVDPAAQASTTYAWTFEKSSTVADNNLVAYMEPNSWAHMPVITATNGENSVSYQAGCYAKNGSYYPSWIYSYVDIATSGYWEIGTSKSFASPGDSTATIDDGNGNMVPDDQLDMTLAVTGETGSFWFGKNKYYNACGSAFEAPETPYLLRSVYVLYRHSADNSVDSLATMICTGNPALTVQVYKMASIPAYDATKSVTPTLGELIGSGTATLDMSASVPAAAYGGENDGLMVYPLKFDLLSAAGAAITPEINSAIMVVVSGYDNAAITRFEIPVSRDINDDGFGELGYLGNIKNGVTTLSGINNLLNAGAIKTAPAICLDVLSPYISFNEQTPDVRRVETYKFISGGETKTVKAISSNAVDTWTATQLDGTAIPSWLTVTPTNATTTSGEYTSDVTLTAAALPENVKYREDTVKLAIPGSYIEFICTQGENTGVQNVKVDGNKAYTSNGDFVVTATGNVNIFNVAGKLVKSAVLNGGTSVIDGQDLAKGVYIIRYANGKATKVVK
jgi:hypothetical protein